MRQALDAAGFQRREAALDVNPGRIEKRSAEGAFRIEVRRAGVIEACVGNNTPDQGKSVGMKAAGRQPAPSTTSMVPAGASIASSVLIGKR